MSVEFCVSSLFHGEWVAALKVYMLILFHWVSGSEAVISYARHLEKKHDMLLGLLFQGGTYTKLYSYRHLINGFAVHVSPEQVKINVHIVTS